MINIYSHEHLARALHALHERDPESPTPPPFEEYENDWLLDAKFVADHCLAQAKAQIKR